MREFYRYLSNTLYYSKHVTLTVIGWRSFLYLIYLYIYIYGRFKVLIVFKKLLLCFVTNTQSDCTNASRRSIESTKSVMLVSRLSTLRSDWGVAYDFALSFIPISHGQRFTDYHR